MRKNKSYHHVLPNSKVGWDIIKDNAIRATRRQIKTQQLATDIARKISKNQGTALMIHGKDGKARVRDHQHERDSQS
ncbi:Uncharacterised protein [Legionella beliardensis]|uniref:DUF2188 domain-containing protein n=1 Tax=Legionella beliardensis TaxID=91822 RepID=A0A378I3A9_9GAMM|nr:DUF2188 domain-containing protein [Legionella beliardensis]STX29483.1 Uncharacterised protein [Legionella beliardensis]